MRRNFSSMSCVNWRSIRQPSSANVFLYLAKIQGPPIATARPMQTAARENLTSVEPVWIDRRRAMRFPTNDAAEVEVDGDPSLTLSGFLRDASRTGVRLALPQPLPRGAQVRISVRGAAAIAGEVRYCRWAGTIYYAGVMLRADNPRQ